MKSMQVPPTPFEEARTFRRFPFCQDAGIRLDPNCTPHQLAEVPSGRYLQCQSAEGFCYRSVLVRDLSLTGLYFLTALPYRVGCALEVQLALPDQTLYLPAVVRRLTPPSLLPLDLPAKTFGCGVDFLFSRMQPSDKRALMDFLMQRFSPAALAPRRSPAS